MLKKFIVRFRVPLLILALLLSLGGNIMLGLRLYRSAALRANATSYHAGSLRQLWQDARSNISGAVAARDRDDDIRAYRERLGQARLALYGAGLNAEALSQSRGDGAFRDLAAVLDRYGQSMAVLAVAQDGISAEDSTRLAAIEHDIAALAGAYPAEFMSDATAEEIRSRTSEVCRDLSDKDLSRDLCD
jgi:hypothetical protein